MIPCPQRCGHQRSTHHSAKRSAATLAASTAARRKASRASLGLFITWESTDRYLGSHLVNGWCPQLDQWNIPTCGMKYGLHMDYKPLTKWDAHQSSGRDDVEFIGRTCWWSDKPRKSEYLDIMGYNGLKCGVGMGRKSITNNMYTWECVMGSCGICMYVYMYVYRHTYNIQ